LINSDVDNKKAGSYTVKITAFDINGNKAESSYQVTVKEKPQEQAPIAAQPSNQSSGYSGGYSNNTGSTSSSSVGASGNATSNSGSSASSTAGNASSNQNNNQPHVHWGPAVEGMYFDSDEECEAWARQYQEHQWFDLGNSDFGCAWGAQTCSCGKVYITGFY